MCVRVFVGIAGACTRAGKKDTSDGALYILCANGSNIRKGTGCGAGGGEAGL